MQKLTLMNNDTEQKKHNLTIYDIAEKAGVSTATVSRVLNNYPYVKKSTKTKVWQVLAESNYIPNETARNLSTNSSKMIGVLIADIRTTHHTDGIYYIEQEFYKHGYTCLIYNTGYDSEIQASYIQMLSRRKVEAVVLIGSVYQNSNVTAAIQIFLPTTPVAILNGYIPGANTYSIIADEENGVYESIRLLSSRGKKHPAFIYSFDSPSNKLKIAGFKRGVNDFMNTDYYIADCSNDTEKKEITSLELITKYPEIDSIVYAEDILALIGIKALTEKGIAIPDQIAIIGMNNSYISKFSIPSLTTIDNALYDLSITATKNLLAVLNGERVNRKMIICTEVIEREST